MTGVIIEECACCGCANVRGDVYRKVLPPGTEETHELCDYCAYSLASTVMQYDHYDSTTKTVLRSLGSMFNVLEMHLQGDSDD